MLTQQQITDSLALIINTFKSFRAELMQSYGTIEHDTKGDSSPVTSLDVKIETVLKEKLLAQFPDFGFKGEETDEVIGKNGATWLVDPIDSTSSFIHGLPFCANMAGLIVDGEVVAAVIYHFVTDELFTALKGQGAYKNDQKIIINNTTLNDSYVFADAYAYINMYPFYANDNVKFYAPMGATGYFFTRLAQGSIQGIAYLRARIKPHDVAPGLLISREAGAQTVSLTGKPFDYTCSRFVAGTANICHLTSSHLDEIMSVATSNDEV